MRSVHGVVELARGDACGYARFGLDEEHVLHVLLLAEVDLDRRTRVPGRRGRGHPLRAVEVTEGDVVRVLREVQPLDAVVEDRLRVALAAAERSASHEAVRGDEVDGVGPEALAQRRDQQPHPLGVEAGGLRGVQLEHLLGANRVALRDERQEDDGRPLACVRGEIDNAAQLRARGVAEQRDAGRVEHGRPRIECVLVVVVATDRDDARAGRPQGEQRVPDDRVARRAAARPTRRGRR